MKKGSNSLSTFVSKELKKLKFKEFGEYMFVEIKRKNHANKVFDYIEENFEFSTATANRLSTVFMIPAHIRM